MEILKKASIKIFLNYVETPQFLAVSILCKLDYHLITCEGFKFLKACTHNKEKSFTKQRRQAMLLMVLGSVLISFTGLIIRDMDTAGAFQINLYRWLSLFGTTFIILFWYYRASAINKILEVGRPGVAASSLLALAGICLIPSITTTTVANTLFICGSIPFITALLAWIFLNEKISKPTLFTMAVAGSGVGLMMFSGLGLNSIYGPLMALVTAISFSGYAVLLRKNKNIEMLPCLLISGLIMSAFCLLLLLGDIRISWPDLVKCVLLGSFGTLIPNTLFIHASKYLLAAELTLFMLLEFALGPLWVWFVINEIPSHWTLVGGTVIIFAVIIFVFYEIK